jgi:choline dehydrogenase-like flavoprotein
LPIAVKESRFNYIIVGAGSAGCALANRLSEDPNKQVLVIEAGHWAKQWMRRMPAAIKQMMFQPQISWGFRSEPEAGLKGRQLNLRRGKVVGGCSVINGMTYSRGHPNDYNDWAQRGCSGWSYADVLPYFRRSELSWAGRSAFHGDSGPLAVTRPNIPALMIDIFREATVNAGLPGSEDYHADYREGFTPVELTVGGGKRASTADAYLAPALKRRNLSLMTDAHVTRVIVKKGRAMGVDCVRGGKRIQLWAHEEVVLSAGAYGSPHILLLSGIGDPDHLRSRGVRVVHESPEVGRNLSEHPMYQMHFHAQPRTFVTELRLDRAIRSVLQWAAFGNGPFATTACAGNTYVKSHLSLDRPDIQINMAALYLGSWLWWPLGPTKPRHGLSANLIALTQGSQGSVTLASADPFASPRIQLNLLTHPGDIKRMIDAIRIARHIYSQSPLNELVTGEDTPGESASTDAQLEEVIRRQCLTAEHPVGTCRMGAEASAVLDPDLRVRGISGLRVVDASIMPTNLAGNINAPTIMIAEKAADLIKGHHHAPQGVAAEAIG